MYINMTNMRKTYPNGLWKSRWKLPGNKEGGCFLSSNSEPWPLNGAAIFQNHSRLPSPASELKDAAPLQLQLHEQQLPPAVAPAPTLITTGR